MSSSVQVFLFLCMIFVYVGAEEIFDGKACTAARNVFTEKNTEFERCTMQHAAADNFCFNCIVFYVEQFQSYNVLFKLCGALLLEEDHFDILRTHFTRSNDLWHNASCTSENDEVIDFLANRQFI